MQKSQYMLLNLKIFKICIMHEFALEKAKIYKHAWKKYQYLESLSHKTIICKDWEVLKTCICMEIRALMINIERKICLSWDLNLRSAVLRTGILPLNHWDTDTTQNQTFLSYFNPSLPECNACIHNLNRATQQVVTQKGLLLCID